MGYHPPILDFIKTPISIFLEVFNIFIFYQLNKKNVPIERVGTSANALLENHEYWRAITASFSHFSFLHIIFNISSMWSVRLLEQYLGISKFLIYITILVIFPPFLDAIIRKRFDINPEIWGIGYSCVICGLMTIIDTFSSSVNFFGFDIPWSISPFLNIIVTSILIPNASFIGHLSGVLIGYLIRWHFVDWITPKLFYNIIPWVLLLFFINYLKTNSNSFSFIKISKTPFSSTHISNGRIEQV